jgi:hypothetical protein
MQQARYGFCRLEVLVTLTRLAFRRAANALMGVAGHGRRRVHPPGDVLVAVSADLESAIARRLAGLRSAFPDAPAPPRAEGPRDPASLLAALRRVQRLWVDALGSLADDNELDVPRCGPAGRARPTMELLAEAILQDAELAGRIAARLGA